MRPLVAVSMGISVLSVSAMVSAEQPVLEPGHEETYVDAGAYPGMTQLLDEAVKKLAIERNQEAIDRLEQKDYPGALMTTSYRN